jgi:hypothetical protein
MAADPAAIMRRHSALITKRSTIETTWRECFDHTYPVLGSGLSLTSAASSGAGQSNAGYAKGAAAKLYDSTAKDAVRIQASAFVSAMVPGSSLWVGYGVEGYKDDDIPDDARLWLDDAAQLTWENIHLSNFDGLILECMMNKAIAGWFPLFIDEDTELGGYTFEQWPLAGTYIGASRPGGVIDIAHREYTLTAEQCVNEFGENMVSEVVRAKASKTPDAEVAIVQALYPRAGAAGQMAKNMPIASCHIERDTKQILRESGYHEMPLVVPRWMLIPDSCYPFGPVYDALDDIKTLNEAKKFSLQNMDLAVSGMWAAVDDGVLNPRSITVGARKVIVVNDTENIKALTPGGKFELGAIVIEDLQRSIRKVLMADQLEPYAKNAEMTATEVQVRVELIRQLLGPLYSRMQSEFLQAMIKRCFGIGYRAGAFGQPPDWLDQKSVAVRYTGPLARSQKLVDVAAMDRYETTLMQEAQLDPSVLDNYKLDDAARRRAELLGVPGDLVRDTDERDALRESRKQSQAQQQAAAVVAPALQKGLEGAMQ